MGKVRVWLENQIVDFGYFIGYFMGIIVVISEVTYKTIRACLLVEIPDEYVPGLVFLSIYMLSLLV
jgi:hypothetical protein